MQLRYQGYRETLEVADIPFDPKYQIEGDRGRIPAREMARKLLSLDDPPTAIFAASDTQAIGAIEAAVEMGIDVPQELSVVGYDDIRDAAYVELTTIDQHLVKSGVDGATMLFELLKEPQKSKPCQEILSVDLVVRGTTQPPQG
jgi:DNA-binding LacI/PurR family transcriptional regulator